jgi:hypothetical protein
VSYIEMEYEGESSYDRYKIRAHCALRT